ncbi:family S53 protease [Mycena alexandri]|uniref:tripeptidyl-peptidase II n=1 Tax=Mycena alexandri TaxID=1745969 RepID=A0AAD6WW77_9AGAR|nr:family S53 protease [Mycena alexandri]
MRRPLFCFPILFSTICSASNVLILHEKRDAIPAGFFLSRSAPSETMLDLRMALKQSDTAGLERALHAVSTPGNPAYGKHLTSEEVAAYTKPSEESFDVATSWLKQRKLLHKAVSHAGDWLQFSISVEKANEYFGANFSLFTHTDTGSEIVRTLEYSLPAELTNHIKVLHPTLSFSPPNVIPKISLSKRHHLASRQAPDPTDCTIFQNPACLQAKYNIPTTSATQSSNMITVTGFQFNNPSVFLTQSFLNFMRPDKTFNVTFGTRYVAGASNSTSEGNSEVSLDMEYVMGLATDVPVTFLGIGPATATPADFPTLLLEGFGLLLNDTNPPQVVSTSYGADESFYSPAISESVCNLFMQLGARGVSLLFSSGDGGVQTSSSTGVGDNTATCKAFGPTFPSGCPWVTSVGATRNVVEIAAFLSSGGFSNVFPAPSYQAADTAAYVAQLGSTYRGMYNASGRGFPDVSALGLDFQIRDHRFGWQTDSGTSASTPVFASVISLINDRLTAAGKSPLGFLNPFLYSAAGRAALNDITEGSNPGCNTTGFAAGAGWDPVTGLGSPNFPKLLAAAMTAAV